MFNTAPPDAMTHMVSACERDQTGLTLQGVFRRLLVTLHLEVLRHKGK